MFLPRRFCPAFRHSHHNAARNYQVTVVGGANEVGQAICLLLRAQPKVTKLVLHDDEENAPGVVLDLSHIPSESSVSGYYGKHSLDTALAGSDVVIATGGTIRKPGVSKDKWFATNTAFIKNLAIKVSRVNPLPFLGIVTEPINTLVPMAAEILRTYGYYDPKKLFGITTTEILRAQTAYATRNSLTPGDCFVPVIGGHSEKTIVPLLSNATPECKMPDSTVMELTHTIRKAYDAVTVAKKGWAPTISTAHGVLEFTCGILNALDGNKTKINAFVENNDLGTSFFSGLVEVDQSGAGEMQSYSNLSPYECHLLENCVKQLRKDVERGKKMLECEV